MGQAKGGKKLRRSSKHASKYQVQFLRTQTNKHNAAARIRRRLAEMPKQAHPVKPNRETRIIRRNVREHQRQMQRHQNKQKIVLVVVKQLDMLA
jgi:hypothetical protein